MSVFGKARNAFSNVCGKVADLAVEYPKTTAFAAGVLGATIAGHFDIPTLKGTLGPLEAGGIAAGMTYLSTKASSLTRR